MYHSHVESKVDVCCLAGKKRLKGKEHDNIIVYTVYTNRLTMYSMPLSQGGSILQSRNMYLKTPTREESLEIKFAERPYFQKMTRATLQTFWHGRIEQTMEQSQPNASGNETGFCS
jgi:hypothetical protein